MANYAKPLPVSTQDHVLQEFPAPVKAVTSVVVKDDTSVSSAMSLHPMTTNLEVSALQGAGIAIRWVPTTETASVAPRASVISSGLGANFDHLIHAGETRRFAVPKETQGRNTVPMQIGSMFGLYQRMAMVCVNAASASSVIVVQY